MLLPGENMNLKEYLFLESISIKEFSELLECSRLHLSRIINGRLKPSKRLAKDIEEATQGKVTVNELLKDTQTNSDEKR